MPSFVSIRAGTPPRYFGMGSVAPGNADGWGDHVAIERTPQLVGPLELAPTKVGYSLNTGVVISVQELVAVAAASEVIMPWDRTPIAVGTEYTGELGSHTWTLRFSYTVPTGKKLFLSQSHVFVSRRNLPTTLLQCGAWIAAGGVRLAFVMGHLPAVGSTFISPGGGSGQLVMAGSVIEAWTYCSCTGGAVNFNLSVAGYTFDA